MKGGIAVKVKRIITVVISIVLIVIGVGCTSGSEEKGVEPNNNVAEKVDIRGRITNVVNNADNVEAILVEGELEEDTGYDKASIKITTETEIYKGTTGASANELQEGVTVEAIFTGLVAESYPVQATAKVIRIIR